MQDLLPFLGQDFLQDLMPFLGQDFLQDLLPFFWAGFSIRITALFIFYVSFYLQRSINKFRSHIEFWKCKNFCRWNTELRTDRNSIVEFPVEWLSFDLRMKILDLLTSFKGFCLPVGMILIAEFSKIKRFVVMENI